jgi:5,10-methenyltetrahydrofolate synthetase
MSDKAELRQELKAARLALPPEEVARMSMAIVEQLRQIITETKPMVVHCFETIKSKHEVDVLPMIEFLKNQKPKPVIYTSQKVNDWWQVVSLDGPPVYRQPHFDFVIVPMLGFDGETLHRLGNGGGYYDRMLSRQLDAFKIGVCFEIGKLSNFPAKPHDIALDVVVTEKQVYRRP